MLRLKTFIHAAAAAFFAIAAIAAAAPSQAQGRGSTGNVRLRSSKQALSSACKAATAPSPLGGRAIR